MSRSALWRQEANVKERQRQAEETFLEAIEEGRNAHVKGQLPLYGADDKFNMNPMLLQNVAKSPYFQKCCHNLKDWNSLVDEIYYEAKHMEPWTPGAVKTPSTAFCLLVRLFTLRCSEKQMALMLDHVDSPYIRCIGFLYLRYAVDPSLLWGWVEPYLYDPEPVQIAANPSKPQVTVGKYVRSLLNEMDYHGTLLPRLPVQIEREIKVKLLQAEQIEERAVDNMKDKHKMEHFQRVGGTVRALYGDEENPVTWYDAVVDRVVMRDDETGEELARPKFHVTFPEYGNTELVSLGEMDLITPTGGASSSSSSGRHHDPYHGEARGGRDDFRGRGRDDGRQDREWDRSRGDRDGSRGYDRDRGYGGGRRDYEHGGDRHRDEPSRRDRFERDGRGREDDYRRNRDHKSKPPPHAGGNRASAADEKALMDEVLRREREKSAAKGKAYAARPATFKESLSAKQDESTSSRKRSYSPDRREKHSYNDRDRRDNVKEPPVEESSSRPARREKTSEELAAVQEKKRKLMAKYG